MTTLFSLKELLRQTIASLRLLVVTVLICSGLYTLTVLFAGKLLAPVASEGSLIRSEKGTIIGSELIAQPFSRAEYFSPRPSAVSWNGSASGGSNLSPASSALRERAQKQLSAYHLKKNELVPADLVSASGSGLDPHISLEAARFQAKRIAEARHVPIEQVMKIINNMSIKPNPLTNDIIVNVLLLNRELDQMLK
jgi:K+-transporting ATPase ATPase C chain